MDDTVDDAVTFQIAQLLNEHLLSNARDRAFELAETERPSAKKLEQDRELPSSFKDLQRFLDADRCDPRRDARIYAFLSAFSAWCVHHAYLLVSTLLICR